MAGCVKAIVITTALVSIAGCGGGGGGGDGGDTATGSAAQGLWVGTTDTNRTVTGIVLSDGTYYVLYSRTGNANIIAGLVQGTGSSGAGTFSSSNARDINFEGFGVLPASVSANYAAKQSFNGTVSYSAGGATSFTTTYDADYGVAPTLAAIAGRFSGQVATSQGVESVTLTVSTSGAISSGGSSCSFSGRATPRGDGNAYDMSLTFGAAPCFFANQTLTGIAYYSASSKQLFGAALNAARSNGGLFVGTRL